MLLCSPGAHAETVAGIESPGKVLRVEPDVTEGRLSYRVSRLGETYTNGSNSILEAVLALILNLQSSG